MSAPASIVCLGEALVDLICPDRLAPGERAASFEAHCGGALANVAVAVARSGAHARLVCGVGDDEFGLLLRERLEAEGVDLALVGTVPGLPTPFAFVRFDEHAEPHFDIHGESIDAGFAALAGREREIAEGAAAIAISSNTLPGEPARSLTFAVREQARAAGTPIVFDPNLRPGRWSDLDLARELCLEFVAGSRLTKSNLAEARWLAGEPDLGPAAAAEFLVGAGAELGVVTDGPRRAVARGLAEAEAKPPAVESPWPMGAGDAFMGTLAGRLCLGGWEPGAVGEALAGAAAAAADACRTPAALG
jgi:fructokinase